MGNTNSKTKSNIIPNKPSNKQETILNTKQWMKEIEKQRTKYSAVSDDEEYQLFVNYLIFPFYPSSSFYISIIVRLISHYIGDVSPAKIVFNINDMWTVNSHFIFNTDRVSIAIHPINGDIYIADQYTLYKLKNSKLHLIAQIHDQYNKSKYGDYVEQDVKITDLTFNPNGNLLFCLINNDYSKIYHIDYNNDGKKHEEKISHTVPYDINMDIMKYDFNNYYLSSQWLQELFNGTMDTLLTKEQAKLHVANQLNSSNYTYSVLFRLDPYSRTLWILADYRIFNSKNNMLFKIPFEWVNKVKQLNSIKNQNNNQILSSIGGEVIELNMLSTNQQNYVDVTAFDVDKYYNGIYMITSNKMLYRIEKCVDEINCKSAKWKLTHKILLTSVLPKRLHVASTIRYNSVTGRIIICDTKTIQSIAI